MIDKTGLSTGKEIRTVLEKLEDELLINYRNYFDTGRDKLTKDVNINMWQNRQLQKLQGFRNSNRQIISKYGKDINKAIMDDLEESYYFGVNATTKKLIAARKAGIEVKKPDVKLSFAESPKAKELTRQMQFKVNNSINNVLRGLEQQYTSTVMNISVTIGNVTTLYKAIDEASKVLLESGLTGSMTINGRRLNFVNDMENNTIEISQEIMHQGQGDMASAADQHLVIVTAHASSCKQCTPWQNKVLVDDVYQDGKPYGPYKTMLSYAIENGLLHYGCRHNLITFIPGVDKRPELDDNIPKNKSGSANVRAQHELYDKEQEQRYCERQIRKYKRIETGSLSDDDKDKAHLKVLQWQARRSQLVEDTPGLYRSQTWREKSAWKIPADNRARDLRYNKKLIK